MVQIFQPNGFFEVFDQLSKQITSDPQEFLGLLKKRFKASFYPQRFGHYLNK